VEALDLSRWQFGITTVYHFIFVPLTIGLTPLVALLQTIWHKTGKDEWYRLTRFFGKLLLINFALGIVTGIVQEFQFGMNWSEYSRHVGDIFGAPLAMEALTAFFVESTFLGVWIFGWGRLSRRVHLASIWLVAFATNLSAFYILAANSFMQYPKGAEFNVAQGRATMTSATDMLFSRLSLSTFWHTISTSFVVAGTFMAGIAVWWMVKAVRAGREDQAKVYRKAGVIGSWFIIVAGISLIFSGHHQAQVVTQIQPTKMAAAEMLCTTSDGVGFTVIAFGECAATQQSDGTVTWNDDNVTRIITIPKLLSLLAYNSTSAEVMGADQATNLLTKAYEDAKQEVNPADLLPNQGVVFWTFRLMILFGVFSAVLAIGALIALRGGKVSGSGGLKFWAGLALPMPFIGAAFGWIFTEMGRQPYIVYPLWSNGTPDVSLAMGTEVGVSPIVATGNVWATMITFTVLYLTLAVAWFYLMKRYTAMGAPFDEPMIEPKSDLDESKPLTFSY
jgi:cytochrome d ubiquinol oxidase subunit I